MNDYTYIDENGDYIDYYQLVNDNGLMCKEIEQLQQQNKQLKERINKAIDYNNHLIEHAKYHLNLSHLKKMKKILLGDSNE